MPWCCWLSLSHCWCGHSKIETALGTFSLPYLVFVDGIIGDNFLFPSIGDSDDFAFVWIKLHHLPICAACLCLLAICLSHVL